MLNLKEEALDEIDDYIHNHDLSSRYEIDKSLLRLGFDPEWIDECWQNQAKKQRTLTRYKRIEKRIFLINIFLLVWFFKPNLPLFYDVQNNDSPSQAVLVPFVLLFFGGILLWYKRRPYGKFAEKPRYFLTVVPIIPLLLLFTISFVIYQHYLTVEVRNGRDGNAQYKTFHRNIDGDNNFFDYDYRCDNFGLVCFKPKSEREIRGGAG